MFGGACTQTPELMPLPAALSRSLCNRLTQCVHSNDLLRPDGKTQVTVEFDELGNVVGIDTGVSFRRTPSGSVTARTSLSNLP